MKKIAVLLSAAAILCAVTAGIPAAVQAASLAGQSLAAVNPIPPPDNPIKIGPLPNVSTGPERIQALLSVVFTIIGAISLLMFTIGGLRYIASQGDPQAIAKAKGTLIYALVGLAVSISAVAIVNFVLGNI